LNRNTQGYKKKDQTLKLTEDLRSVTATAYLDADVNLLELVVANKEHGLEDLVPHGLREETINRVSVDVQNTLSPLAVSDRNGILLKSANTMQKHKMSIHKQKHTTRRNQETDIHTATRTD